MKRDFLEGLGLEKEAIDKIMAENGADLEREKAKTTTAKADLADAQAKLNTANTELETLKKANGDIAAVQQQLSELQTKYDTDTTALKGQIADRDYSDAISKAIAEKGLKFSSKAAEKAFIADLMDNRLEVKDGVPSGFDERVKAHREADPDAFAPDKPAPSFGTRPVGGGGQHQTTGETLAEQLGKASAEQSKAANNIISGYLKGEY